jgi:polysaccharide pyruvyl transferase WcaK-like protein
VGPGFHILQYTIQVAILMTTKIKSALVLTDVSGMGPDYHVGDEAMAEVALSRLARILGRENLVLACAAPANASLTYGVKAIPLYTRTFKQRLIGMFKSPLSTLREFMFLLYYMGRSDLVFIAGGGNHTSVWPDVLESRLFLLRLARFFKKRIVFASQTLGPFTDAHRAACQDVFSAADWMGVRDRNYSASQLDIPVHFAVDDAVFLPSQHDDQTRGIANGNAKLVGLSLRNFKGVTDQQQHELCRALVPIISKHQAATVFIPHHARANMGDLDIARRISPLWPQAAPLLVLNPIPHASAVRALTENCSWVVTMRYHQLIFSLSVGVPCVGIYVDEYTKAKLNGAFEQFDMTPRLVSLAEAPEKIESLIDDALMAKDTFVSAAKRTLDSALEQSMEPYRVVAEMASCGSSAG